MSVPDGPAIDVIHLVYRPFGLDPFRRFIASYREHPAGTDHRLLVAFKGFVDETDTLPWRALLDDVPHDAVLVPDGGLDIGSYLTLAASSSADLLCLFNSRSVILANDWLAKLGGALAAQGGGAVAATGSWQGFASDPWRRHYPTRRRGWARGIQRAILARWTWLSFPPFPNPHLRTNAMLLPRRLLLSLGLRPPQSKRHAMAFESGWHGLSRTLRRRKLPIALVGRDGRSFAIEDWPTSDIFWQGGQNELLVADNQTEMFAAADSVRQAELSDYAWHEPQS